MPNQNISRLIRVKRRKRRTKLNPKQKKNNNLIDKIIKISRPGSPWRFTAHELLTSYYIKNNDLNSAIQSLNIITEDNEAPPFMKERALLLLESIKENITTYTEERERLSKEKHLYELATTLLKDTGIKTRIIKQYLPIINKLINKYLSAMDFYITFELDENFNETIKSRHRDEFTYASFSEGEKMRIDLALLFTWRAVAKLKNSVNTNLLVLDEVFDSSLDASGTDEFLKILYDLTHGTSSNINVFVISHKGEVLYDKFEKTVKFQKQKNFSTLAA